MSAFLSLSLTPVQGFIEASRSLRDLKSGSAVLGHLSAVAMETAGAKGGDLVFPSQAPAGGQQNVPNTFLARYGSKDAAEGAANACRDAVQTRWKEIAQETHHALARAIGAHVSPELSQDWDTGWEDQIRRYWDVQTVVLAVSDVPKVLEALTNAAPAVIGLGEEFRAIQALLASHKMIRRFPGDNGIGRHKCALMGEWEQMGPADPGVAREFWEAISSRVSVEGLRLTPRDRLCAPALVKRFCLVSNHLNAIRGDVPDTAAVATEAWWQQAQRDAPKIVNAFQEAVMALRQKLGEKMDTDRRYLLGEDLSARSIARETGMEENLIVEEATKVAAVLKDLRAEVKQAGLGVPPSYYAVLVQDGDEIGQWLSGAKKKAFDQAFLNQMSQQLQQYAVQVSGVVSSRGGHLVYAGGDDALAVLPLSTALACASELRSQFPEFARGDDGSIPTLSAGLAIVHHKDDLRAAVRAARAAERRAKDTGRDSLGINLVKRSGGPVELTLKWELLADLGKLQALFAAGVSDGWLPQVEALGAHLSNWCCVKEPVACLIGQATRGLYLTDDEKVAVARVLSCAPEKAATATRDHLKALWGKLWTATEPEGEAPRDSSEFLQKALERFLSLGLIASFLHRGRE